MARIMAPVGSAGAGSPASSETEVEEAEGRALFGGGGDDANMPSLELTEEDFAERNPDILALLVKAGLCPSRSDARKNVEQGGVTVEGEKLTDPRREFTKEEIGEGIVLRRGKKKYCKVVVK